jgi:hypothetical protein
VSQYNSNRKKEHISFFFNCISSQISNDDDNHDIKIMDIFDEKLNDYIGDDQVRKEYYSN